MWGDGVVRKREQKEGEREGSRKREVKRKGGIRWGGRVRMKAKVGGKKVYRWQARGWVEGEFKRMGRGGVDVGRGEEGKGERGG